MAKKQRRSAQLIFALCPIALTWPITILANSPRPFVAQSAEQRERFCIEEQRLSEPWIHWASTNRALCTSQSQSATEKTACLSTVRQQLDALHSEHRTIYLSQMRSLQPDHPVMQGILKRLQSHKHVASLALEADLKPAELSALSRENCLRQH
ncbi:MAG: hypothetical protein EBR85_08785 [Betaproteobacteria bacterium]|jgi:hypothetical protein|nr:hypothetical protein [Betaproteobacteria bacterium]